MNEGTLDRVVRVVVGLVLLLLVFFGPQSTLRLFGLEPLLTGHRVLPAVPRIRRPHVPASGERSGNADLIEGVLLVDSGLLLVYPPRGRITRSASACAGTGP